MTAVTRPRSPATAGLTRALARMLPLAVTIAGCDLLTGAGQRPTFSGDPFPIIVDATSGAVIVGLTESGRSGTRTAVIDMLSPFTAIDRGTGASPALSTATLTIYGAIARGEPLVLPRARFVDTSVVTLHPCHNRTPVCEVGSPGAPRAFDALVGVNAFASDALRLRLASEEIFIFPDIAGDDLHRSRACDAVLPSPFRGGGTLILGGAEVRFTNYRIAIDTCIAPNPDPQLPQRQRGLDALLVLSTAIGPSLLNESTYARYRQLDPTVAELDVLPQHSVLLPSGPVSGRLTELPSLALVGNLGSNPRAPCRQVYAHHLLTGRDCAHGDDCPCGTDRFCPVPAIVEIAPPLRIPVLIVPDSDPTLLALRTELRPDRPEVNGILGTDALHTLELDIDYSHDRVLARCVDRTSCGARVTLAEPDSRRWVTGCLGDTPGPLSSAP
jgi:hypothetical protein